MDFKLIGAPLSPFVRKTRMLLIKKGIEYTLDASVAPLAMPDDYERVHPLKKIPAMIVTHNGKETVIPDSSPICAMLEKLNPDPSFYPEDPIDYAQALWLEEYADTEIAAKGTSQFFRTIFFAFATGQPPDMSHVEKGFIDIDRISQYLGEVLDNKEWLVGSQMSLADISVVSHFVSIQHAGYRLTEADGAGLYGLVNRVMADPVMAQLIEKEQAAMTKMNFERPDLNAYRKEKGL